MELEQNLAESGQLRKEVKRKWPTVLFEEPRGQEDERERERATEHPDLSGKRRFFHEQTRDENRFKTEAVHAECIIGDYLDIIQ